MKVLLSWETLPGSVPTQDERVHSTHHSSRGERRERRVEAADQAAGGAAGEAQSLGLAARGGELADRRLADHGRLVAVGDQQSAEVGMEAFLLERGEIE